MDRKMKMEPIIRQESQVNSWGRWEMSWLVVFYREKNKDTGRELGVEDDARRTLRSTMEDENEDGAEAEAVRGTEAGVSDQKSTFIAFSLDQICTNDSKKDIGYVVTLW